VPQKISLTIRVDASDVESWKRSANLSGLNMSEWMRRRCNGEGHLLKQYTDFRGTEKFAPQPESEKGNGSADNQNVRGTAERSVSGRRVAASERRTARRGRGRLREIEDVANTAFRTSSHGNRGENRAPGTGKNVSIPVRPESLQAEAAEHTDTVTRENFAEVLATIPKDEIDRWARSLPRDVLPKHEASANRLTDLCASCLEYRRVNGIPYGGLPKKEKR
jgi:hypothetical protein